MGIPCSLLHSVSFASTRGETIATIRCFPKYFNHPNKRDSRSRSVATDPKTNEEIARSVQTLPAVQSMRISHRM